MYTWSVLLLCFRFSVQGDPVKNHGGRLTAYLVYMVRYMRISVVSDTNMTQAPTRSRSVFMGIVISLSYTAACTKKLSNTRCRRLYRENTRVGHFYVYHSVPKYRDCFYWILVYKISLYFGTQWYIWRNTLSKKVLKTHICKLGVIIRPRVRFSGCVGVKRCLFNLVRVWKHRYRYLPSVPYVSYAAGIFAFCFLFFVFRLRDGGGCFFFVP